MRDAARPNVIVILADDMGYSDIGCYGGEIDTPNLDSLAGNGLQLTQFYNTARCSPSRASLLTGLHPHQTGVGILTRDDLPAGYPGTINERCVTIAEVLQRSGYGTYMCGKWHVSGHVEELHSSWPRQRGFDRFFGTLNGGGSYYEPATLMEDEEAATPTGEDFYYTDAISDAASQYVRDHVRQRPDEPFFSYVAYTAPHWPLHAPEEEIERYRGRYADGWRATRDERIVKQRRTALFGSGEFEASDDDPKLPAWESVQDPGWEERRMEVYAAQVSRMDAGIGQILSTLDELGIADNTCVVFLSDNGGCAEEIPAGGGTMPFDRHRPDGTPIAAGNVPDVWPGPVGTFSSYGRAWANVSNAPFREYKHWVHEGGIATPFIVRWPDGVAARGEISHVPHQLPDVMATVLEMTGADYPNERRGERVPPCEGISMLSTWRETPAAVTSDRHLFWEHEGNAAIRQGKWKLVRKYPGPWELYDISVDRGERRNLALTERERVKELSGRYEEWSDRVGVIPREVWEPLYPPRALGIEPER